MLTALVEASLADLRASGQLPEGVQPKQLPCVQPISGRQRKSLPDSAQLASAAALPLAAACRGQSGPGAPALAQALAVAVNTRQVMLCFSGRCLSHVSALSTALAGWWRSGLTGTPQQMAHT